MIWIMSINWRNLKLMNRFIVEMMTWGQLEKLELLHSRNIEVYTEELEEFDANKNAAECKTLHFGSTT
ncbi:hypothetical protein PUN28_008225 [Cardiocondyla obscurior]|uniref:Uncharacterized protein n=1 Tax=Cardiocondyla obscurior TaxID=286306 RepID=A0AAW2G1L4_9HYME